MGNQHGHDEQQIKSKRLPWLQPQVPTELRESRAKDFMTNVSVSIPEDATINHLRHCLLEADSGDYFIVDTSMSAGYASVGIVSKSVISMACDQNEVKIYQDGLDR